MGDGVFLPRAAAEQLFDQKVHPMVSAEPEAELGLWFDREGNPIGPVGWSLRQQDDGYRCVAEHWVRGWRISTVWFGMDGSHMPPPLRTGPPLIYETMLFAPGGTVSNAEDIDLPDNPTPEQARAAILAMLGGCRICYATEDEARTGHGEAVAGLVALLGAARWEARTWEQHTGQQWAVTVDGWRLVIEDGAIRGIVRDETA